jgi:acyl-CoA synthetase (NDP forming)
MNDIKNNSNPLARLFYPQSIALIGASQRSPWSHMIAGNISAYGYPGKVYAVNKRAAPAHGMEAVASCRDLPEVPDAAFIFVPQEAVLEAVTDAGTAGIKAAVLLTSGYSETGEQGALLQEQLAEVARAHGTDSANDATAARHDQSGFPERRDQQRNR